MDDDWLDDTTIPNQGGVADPLTSREYDRIASRYSDAGYREGIVDGKLSTLQEGFDQSFSASVAPSRQLGNLRGRAAAILAFYSSPSTSSAIAQVQDELRDLLARLNRVKRDDILPRDEEREAHEREEHEGDGEGFELDVNDTREMEGLESALEGMGAGNEAKGKGKGMGVNGAVREGELLDQLERQLNDLESRLSQAKTTMSPSN